MDSVIQAIYDWIKEILVAGVMDNLTCIFDGVNMQVGAVASQVGTFKLGGFSSKADPFHTLRKFQNHMILQVSNPIQRIKQFTLLNECITERKCIFRIEC